MSSSTEATPKLKLTLKLGNSSSSSNSASVAASLAPSSQPESTTISPVKPSKPSKSKKSAPTTSNASSSNTNTSNTTEEPEASFDVRAFVAQMRSFKPRPWTLQPRLSLARNVANELVTVGSGAWCTSVAEPVKLEMPQSSTVVAIQSCPVCAKSFKDGGKYAKHVKTHEKAPKRVKLDETSTASASAKSVVKAPVSIKLKLQ